MPGPAPAKGPGAALPGARIALGSVQFGLDYGISNRDGVCSDGALRDILDTAVGGGIALLDTAAHYGNAEERLGHHLKAADGLEIVTKIPAHCRDAATVAASLDRSFRRLRRARLYAALLHDSMVLTGDNGRAIWDCLRDAREAGKLAKTGVSVYDGDQLARLFALPWFDPEIVQLPLNIFDQRLIEDGWLARLADRGIDIQARSAFLQCLLLMDPETLPAHLAAARRPLENWRRLLAEAGLSPLAGALGFVRAQPEIGHIVVGVTSAAELDEILAAMEGAAETPSRDRLALADPAIIDPRLWPAKAS